MKVLSLSLLFAGAACVYNGGAIDMDDIIHVSSEKEKKMGMSLSAQVEKKFESVEDAAVQERFHNIGKRIAKVCERKEFVYHFKVLKAKEGEEIEKYYNAFTLPGGYVYMFEPLFDALETDDRIAAVTAHEIGHTTARHVIKRLQSSLGTNILMLLALATAQDGRTVAEANEAITHLMLSYSREDEFEADRLSIKYLKKAGFNPDGAVGSLLVLKELRKKGREFPYSPYKSHPYLSERIAAARSEIKGYTDFESYINLPDEKESPY
ncbi:MAG: M48 family metalloprotease [Omnitrophica bacterium]|nr:M48 family metalloprotease [Candidatus Omnitrophota bacterium]